MGRGGGGRSDGAVWARRRLVALVAAMVLAAGCGGDGDGSETADALSYLGPELDGLAVDFLDNGRAASWWTAADGSTPLTDVTRFTLAANTVFDLQDDPGGARFASAVGFGPDDLSMVASLDGRVVLFGDVSVAEVTDAIDQDPVWPEPVERVEYAGAEYLDLGFPGSGVDPGHPARHGGQLLVVDGLVYRTTSAADMEVGIEAARSSDGDTGDPVVEMVERLDEEGYVVASVVTEPFPLAPFPAATPDARELFADQFTGLGLGPYLALAGGVRDGGERPVASVLLLHETSADAEFNAGQLERIVTGERVSLTARELLTVWYGEPTVTLDGPWLLVDFAAAEPFAIQLGLWQQDTLLGSACVDGVGVGC